MQFIYIYIYVSLDSLGLITEVHEAVLYSFLINGRSYNYIGSACADALFPLISFSTTCTSTAKVLNTPPLITEPIYSADT